MAAMQLRQRAINYIDTLDDEQTLRVIAFIENLPQKKRSLQNSKTPEERELAKQALDDLFSMARPTKHEISINGRKEIAKSMLGKYESLN